MPVKLTELTLIFRRERIRFPGGDCCILECDEPQAVGETQQREFADSCGGLNGLLAGSAGMIVKADCPEGELVGGLSYRFYGHWVEHDRHGRQFVAKTFIRVQPHGKAGVIRYLTTTCAGHGVGHATAQKLWDKFQGDAVRILRESPEVAAAAVGMQHFTDAKATAASEVLKDESALESTHIDLIDLLGGKGFPRDTAKKAVAEWGNRAAILIRKNPYLLMRFRGCGFLRTDQLYLDQGGRPAALKRQALAAWYAVARDTEGHTWHRPEVVEGGIRGRVAGADVKPVAAMLLAKRAKMLSVMRNGDGIPWLAESRKAENERTIAEHVRAMLEAPAQWPEVDGLDISEHQATELAKALRAAVGLFGGSPGTGKAQPTDAKILAPTGWVLMGEVSVGSKVIGSDGKPTKVLAIHPQGMQPVYKVSLSDGTSTECTSDHLWHTTTRKERQTKKQGALRDTATILATLNRGDGSLSNHQLPIVCPVEFEQGEYSLHPYLIGLLLGDGCFRGGYPKFTNPEPFLVEVVKSLLPNGVELRTTSNPIDYSITGNGGTNVVTDCLRSLGLMDKLSTEKHIPCVYLFGSSVNRLAVLQGLLDTDASTDGHNIEFSTSSPQLADDVVFLVESLGGTSTVRSRIPTYHHNGKKRKGSRSWRILVMLPPSIQPFRLPRKLERYIPRTKYPPRRYITSVERVGEKVCQCISIENPDGLYLTDHCIVTHNTYTAARLIGRIIDLCGPESIAVCAPTGKAAVRISEALESYGVNKSATTIHRLLGVASRTAGEGWGFAHDESNPLHHKYVVIDEGSMIDTDLFASLLRALPTGTHLLIVGDVNQLPPVGHGAPLRDMIAAGVPFGDLREIRRNAGAIVQACADIRDGKRWQTVTEIDPNAGENLKLIPAASGVAAAEKIVATIRTIKDAKLYDPIWGVQVIVAVNKKSELSRRDLNKRLQSEFNPTGERAGSNPFRIGDKIVCLKNSLVPIVEDCPPDCNRDAEDSKVFVANGEQARVVSVAEKLTVASLDSPKRLVKIPRGTENGDGDKENENDQDKDDTMPATNTGCQWDLAYAISCHKAQGSEWPCVIVALDEYPGARRVCSREWLYTAISRAKHVCLMVGKRSIADGMCMTRAITRRKTFLKELVLGSVK